MKNGLFWSVTLLSIAVAIFLALALYGQTPTPIKGGDKPKSEARKKNEVSKIDQTVPKPPSPHGTFEVSPKTSIPTTNNVNNHGDKSTREWWLIAFTGALVGVGILQFIALRRQAHWMKKQSEDIKQSIVIATEATVAAKAQAETMRKELVLTQRPKLRVRDVVIPDLKNSSLKKEFPSGQLYVVNLGGTPATITNVGCWVEWLPGGLPMEKPYDGENPNCLNKVSIELQAGQSLPLKFEDNRRTWKWAWSDIFKGSTEIVLYVMGFVEYTDNIGTPRRTTFCRQYRWPKGKQAKLSNERRLFPVDDPDYEHEE